MDTKFKSLLLKIIIGAVVLILAIIFISGFSIYMNYLQVKEIGQNFESVFLKNFNTELITQVVCFVIVFLIIFINFLIVRRIMLKVDVSFQFLKNIFPLTILSFVFAFLGSGYIKDSLSQKFLLFMNSVGFGVTDPVFNTDLSYYVFTRPFLMTVVDSIMGVFIFTTIMTCVTYILLYSRLGITKFADILKIRGLTIHALSNVIIIIVIKALSYKFSAEDILYSSFSGGLSGAGYTDIYVWLKFYSIIPFVLIVLAFLSLILLYNNRIKLVVATILVYPLLFIAAVVCAFFSQYFVVQPNEMQAENPYIQRNIDFTRMAYNLDKINEVEFKANNDLTASDLETERSTLDNARIIDYRATLTILNQLQTLRNYYVFKDLNIAVFNIDGVKTPLTISARELKKDPQDSQTKMYINNKLRFTHGYGVVATPINKVTPEGAPMFYIRDIPVTKEQNMPEITEPRIYYGAYDDSYSIVNTSTKEFDYAQNEKTIETVYSGKAGLSLSPLNRLLFSIHYGDYQLLISSFVNNQSKILPNKNIIDRVKTAAPFLTYDETPYLLIDKEGRLKWIIDAYTQTDAIPYSQTNKKINYIRNSAKAVIDAYDGTVELYVVDEEDKLIQAYKRIYPKAFSSEPLPDDLRYSIRYPESYFKIQAEMLKKYHTADSAVFYTHSDIWEFSYEKSDVDNKRFVDPYYNMMNIGGNTGLVLMSPFTIQDKNNMVSWFAAGSDGDNYGQLYLYKFPQGKNVYGTYQIEERIDSNAEISKLMSLWSTGGSTVVRGNLITVPVKDSLIYIKPVYISSGKNNTFPELKMVIAAYGDKIVMESDLKKALDVLFKGAVPTMPIIDLPPIDNIPTPTPGAAPTAPPNSEDLESGDVKKVTDAFNKVQKTSKENDWEAFGKAMKELEDIINEMNKPNE